MFRRFKCGLCEFAGIRKDLRKHIKEVHHIRKDLANTTIGGKRVHQSWWVVEDID